VTVRGRGRAATIAVLGLAAILAGCGSDNQPPPAATPTDVPLPTPVTTTYTLQQTVWYAGLVVHVDSVSSVLRAAVGSLTAELRIENPGVDPASLDAPIRMTSGGSALEPVRGTELPDIDPGGSAAVSVRFDVETGFDVGRATFRIGRTSEHQVIVPLVKGVAALVTNEPRPIAVTGSGKAGSLMLTLKSGVLRADLPDWGLELPPGSLALTVVYDAKYLGTFQGGFAFTAANVGLRLPNGTVVAPRPDGHSQSAAVLLPRATKAGLTSRFDVPIPGPGTYALVIRDGKSGATIPFKIGAAAPGG
jgi:hypothetical protein